MSDVDEEYVDIPVSLVASRYGNKNEMYLYLGLKETRPYLKGSR